jgi:hypothetical protein
MLNYRPLISPDELAKFAQLYFRLSGNQVSPDYLSQTSAKAIVFYKKRRPDDWLGGFVINEGYEGGVMRYLEIFSEDKRQEVLCKLNLLESNLVEITCFFLRRKSSKLDRVFILCMSGVSAYTSRKKAILGASYLPKFCDKLGRIFANQVLFDGKANKDEGVKNLKVFYFKRKDFWSALFRGMIFSY